MTTFWTEETVEAPSVSDLADARPGSAWDSYIPEVYWQEDEVEEDQGDGDDSEEDDFDMEKYNDDGQQLIDDQGEGLIPFDDQQEFDELEF